MKKYSDIFAEDIEVPDIVLQKAGDAFASIITEGSSNMDDKSRVEKKKIRLLKSRTAVAACAGILVLGSVTAAASIRHFWSRGMQGTLQATDKQQQTLTDQGTALVLHEPDSEVETERESERERESEKELSVTNAGITITPETVIADDKFAHISFSVKGYALEENMEPWIETTDVYLGDDKAAASGRVNIWSSFYNGIVADENGSPVYEDGTPLESEGISAERYMDEDGNLEYVVSVSIVKLNDSLLGQTLHVNMKNLGTVSKAQFEHAVDGNWDFAVVLPKKSSAKNRKVGRAVDGTDFVMDSIEISPISIRINYTVNGTPVVQEDENGVPDFCGVVLKDGTRLPYLGNGGRSGYTDESMHTAYVLSAFDRVIEPDKLASVLVRTQAGADMVEIPLHES